MYRRAHLGVALSQWVSQGELLPGMWVRILFSGAFALFQNMPHTDSLSVQMHNCEVVQGKCGFDCVQQIGLAHWCFNMKPDRQCVEVSRRLSRLAGQAGVELKQTFSRAFRSEERRVGKESRS